ncbi:MAG: pyridoxal 5'-phosphate synthase glutaminase subunit PdxT [Atribacterota bacterium]
MKVGVLALQGAVVEHLKMIDRCGHQGIPVKTITDLNKIHQLIIPGGESTTIGKLLVRYHLDEKIIDLYNRTGIPIFGTCAGMILLAKHIEGKKQPILGLINISVKRNAFGRQINSFEAELEIKGITPPLFRGIFIRAPYISKVEKNVELLSRFRGNIVVAREGNILVSSFHPELGNDIRFHQYFLEKIKRK